MTRAKITVLDYHRNALIHQRGNPPDAKYVVLRAWPLKGERLAYLGCWCKSVAAAWLSAARRIQEDRPGPGGNGIR